MRLNKLLIAFIFAALIIPRAWAQDPQDNGESPPNEEDIVIEEPAFEPEPAPFETPAPEPLPQPAQTGESGLISVNTATITPSTEMGKLSLDIKGMDITDVLKMLATRSNMNIIVGKNVTGRVTLFLKEVEIKDAFEIILLANDLAYEKIGNIYNVMTQRDYELLHGRRYQDNKLLSVITLRYAKAADISRGLNQIKTNIGRVVVDEGSNTVTLIDTPEKIREMLEFISKTDLPMETRVYKLGYAIAEKLQPKLQEMITKGVGSVRIDERTNKISVTDYPIRLKEIEALIAAFDEKTPQVLIDAQIIEVRPSDEFAWGVDWDYWIKKHFRMTIPLAAGSVIGIGSPSNITGVSQYKAVVDILRTIGDTKILSSPRIIALNNQEAKILVGTKDAYITSSTSQAGDSSVTSQTVNFVDVGIKLFVTPTVNQDGFVTMKIRPEISSATRTNIVSQNQTTQIPIVSTSEAETTVTIKDGLTVIIAGLKKEQRTKSTQKIPGLGDIPGIGFLFRSITDDMETTDLVILLTPHIVTGDSSFIDFAEVPPKDGAIVNMTGGKLITKRIVPQVNATSAYLDYYSQLTSRIKKIASLNVAVKTRGEVTLNFTISENGELIGDPRVLKSTSKELVPAAIKAVKLSAPFPALPKEIDKREERFSVTIAFR